MFLLSEVLDIAKEGVERRSICIDPVRLIPPDLTGDGLELSYRMVGVNIALFGGSLRHPIKAPTHF